MHTTNCKYLIRKALIRCVIRCTFTPSCVNRNISSNLSHLAMDMLNRTGDEFVVALNGTRTVILSIMKVELLSEMASQIHRLKEADLVYLGPLVSGAIREVEIKRNKIYCINKKVGFLVCLFNLEQRINVLFCKERNWRAERNISYFLSPDKLYFSSAFVFVRNRAGR